MSCEEETPGPSNELKTITTVSYILTPNGGGEDVLISFEDLDGEGGNPENFVIEPLSANTSYTGSIQFLNKRVSPAQDITAEIEEKDEDYQIFYKVSGANTTISYDDIDDDGNPIGLTTRLTTADAGSLNLEVTLRQKPDKSAQGVADGDISNAGGETNITVNYSVPIQ